MGGIIMDHFLDKEVELLRVRWPLLALMSVASIILGTIAIMASFAATMATVFLLGCLLLAGGIVHFIQSFNTRGWSGFFGHVLGAVLYGVAGGYMIAHPAVSAFSLTLIVGMVLAVGGLYQVITSIVARYKSWGWTFLNGIIGIVLGVLIFAQWPVSAFWIIGTFVGIDLILRGWATLMLAMSARAGGESLLQYIHERAEERRTGLKDRRVAA